jgi:asparagine synthase (glutamine-hydrolysing)
MKPVRFVLSVPRNPANAVRIERECTDLSLHPNAGTAMFHSDKDLPLIKVGERGYIVGILFSRESTQQLLSLPDEAPLNGGTEEIASWLVQECWGGFVAILVCPKTSAIHVLVDPSGLCPVYRAETATHVLISTYPALLAKVGDISLSASWPALHSFLARPNMRQRVTCLNGVTELSPGELVSLTEPQAKTRQIWKAENFMPSRRNIIFDEAADQLAFEARKICGAWGKLFGRTVVAASGGVDSSLICGALAAAGISFDCATVATSDPSGDERRFVSILAEKLGVEAFSGIYDLSLIDPVRAVSSGLARPSRKAFQTALEAVLFETVSQAGAQVVMDGNGGDNLFCYLHSAAPVVDRLRCEGFGRGAISTFRDMCQVTGCDIATMTRAVGRRWVRRNQIAPWSVDLRLLAQRIGDLQAVEPLAPWLSTAVGRHGGKRDHLALIMRAQFHLHGVAASGLPRFSPLASQPLLEFCLGIPTWLWCRGGTNRALARAAFATTLPEKIVKRTSKAGPDSFIHQYFNTHRKLLREELLDGLLAQHDVIDRKAVDEAFQSGTRSDSELVLRLLDLAEAENWARSWQD